MKSSEILLAAKKKISNPENWCRFFNAKIDDIETNYNDPLANKWCLVGAIRSSLETSGRSSLETSGKELSYFYEAIKFMGIPFLCLTFINDNSSHSKVISLLDKAISLAQENND